MTDRHTLRRRTLLGAAAVASLGALDSAGAEGNDPATTESPVTPNDSHLAGYANRAGRVATDGLTEAFDDWGDGDITSAELDAVINVWSAGERVVDYEIVELGDIDEQTTLERAPEGEPVVYHVGDSTVDVDAKLEIEPGVAIEFTEGNGMSVNSGPIIAEGTESEPILFTGTNPTRGWWDGIYVTSEAIENKMNHCVVEYGGNGRNANLDLSSGQFDSPGAVTLQNCTLRRSGQYGLTLWYDTTSSSLGSVLRDAENNTYSHNASGPIQARVENAHTLDGSAEFVGNDRSFINLGGETMREDSTWDSLDVPYRVRNGVETDGYDWEIQTGTTVEFEEDTGVDVDSGSVITWEGESPGELPGQHEEDNDRITLTGTQKERGWWDGVYVNSTSTDNVIEWVVIEYGGGGDASANLAAGNLGTGDEGRTTLRNSTLRYSGNYGLRLGYNAVGNNPSRIEDAQNNTYTGNATGAARVRTDNIHILSGTSTFSGNDEDGVDVGSTDLAPLYLDPGEDEVTWDALDVPYRMSGGNHDIEDIDLVIAPGAELLFEETGRLEFSTTTTVAILEGTESNPIHFSGTEDIQGWWDGISFQKTESLLNVMDHCIVEYGGRDLQGNVDVGGEAGATEEAHLEQLTNSVLRHSGENGLYVDSRGSIGNDACNTEVSGNEFENNAGGDCIVN